ncbi:hypothetical protein BDA99DRAFT_533746 [Phascolomyces articulosus]|uniref:F-box domain-containing protein n=1 Tax=Phascolomyces articulosus TaxID=60185 RepID=A0AAD5PHW4_9FUNG|nr:hypothetical protein BDA99DRAFT_533746 [Phascolomyces articulosus]
MPNLTLCLPEEMFSEIFKYIDQKDSVECKNVCQRWSKMAPKYTTTAWKEVQINSDSWRETNILVYFGHHIKKLNIESQQNANNILDQIAARNIDKLQILVILNKEISNNLISQEQEQNRNNNGTTGLIYLCLDNRFAFENHILPVLRRCPSLEFFTLSREGPDSIETSVTYINIIHQVCPLVRHLLWNSYEDHVTHEQYIEWYAQSKNKQPVTRNDNNDDEESVVRQLVFQGNVEVLNDADNIATNNCIEFMQRHDHLEQFEIYIMRSLQNEQDPNEIIPANPTRVIDSIGTHLRQLQKIAIHFDFITSDMNVSTPLSNIFERLENIQEVTLTGFLIEDQVLLVLASRLQHIEILHLDNGRLELQVENHPGQTTEGMIEFAENMRDTNKCSIKELRRRNFNIISDQVLNIFGQTITLMTLGISNNTHITDEGINDFINGNNDKSIKVFGCPSVTPDNPVHVNHQSLMF